MTTARYNRLLTPYQAEKARRRRDADWELPVIEAVPLGVEMAASIYLEADARHSLAARLLRKLVIDGPRYVDAVDDYFRAYDVLDECRAALVQALKLSPRPHDWHPCGSICVRLRAPRAGEYPMLSRRDAVMPLSHRPSEQYP